MATSDCLILGCEYAGKTVLCKQLRLLAAASKEAAKKLGEARFDTTPTIGVELDTIYLRLTSATGAAAAVAAAKARDKDGSGSSGTTLTPVRLREVGAPMRKMWHSYYLGARSVIFVVDANDATIMEQAKCELLGLVTHPLITPGMPFAGEHPPAGGGKARKHPTRGPDDPVPVLVLLNKSDQPFRMPRDIVDAALGLEEIKQHRPGGRFTWLEASSVTGAGLDVVLSWIAANL